MEEAYHLKYWAKVQYTTAALSIIINLVMQLPSAGFMLLKMINGSPGVLYGNTRILVSNVNDQNPTEFDSIIYDINIHQK
jgi:hypothetical protein